MRQSPSDTVASSGRAKEPSLDALVNFDREPIDDEDDCISEGGNWRRVGMLGVHRCQLPAKDAGQPCSTTADCEVACIYVGDPVAPLKDAKARREATKNSVCAPHSPLFGCWTLSYDGDMYDVCLD
jgi:hypothetical protein